MIFIAYPVQVQAPSSTAAAAEGQVKTAGRSMRSSPRLPICSTAEPVNRPMKVATRPTSEAQQAATGGQVSLKSLCISTSKDMGAWL